jgi:excinuclease UvrABC nuclease subunit
MPWNNPNSYQFNRDSIIRNAPSASGVYALHTAQKWVYVGESRDIAARLLDHLNGDNPCIIASSPTHFSYELCPEWERVRRQNALILELQPACNQRLG